MIKVVPVSYTHLAFLVSAVIFSSARLISSSFCFWAIWVWDRCV